MDSNFEESVRRVFADEGGYTNDPRDPGGATNWGITIHDARAYWKRDATPADVRAMPKSAAKQIYKTKYWDAMRCGELPVGLDYAVMDYGVNSGISRSIKVLERLVNLPADGKADDTLIRTVSHRDDRDLIDRLCDERLRFLKGLKTWPVFGKGWGPRVARVRSAAKSMASSVPLPAPKPVEQTEKESKSAKTERPANAPKRWFERLATWVLASGVLGTVTIGSVTINADLVYSVCAFLGLSFAIFMGVVYLVPPRGKIIKVRS